jgi:hypothetical protein
MSAMNEQMLRKGCLVIFSLSASCGKQLFMSALNLPILDQTGLHLSFYEKQRSNVQNNMNEKYIQI